MKFIPSLFLLVSLILEASVTTLPLILLVLICLTVIYKDYSVFFRSLIFGIFLDIFTLKTIGQSSIFFITVMFLILMYQKKFEITTNYFVIFASFFACLSFLFVFGNGNIIAGSIVSVLIGLLMFIFLQKIKIQNPVNSL